MLTVLGGLAEFERELIRARTGEGRARAKASGVKLGRPPKLTPHQRREAIARRDRNGEPVREIARSYNVHHSTISKISPVMEAASTPAYAGAERHKKERPKVMASATRGGTADATQHGSSGRAGHSAMGADHGGSDRR